MLIARAPVRISFGGGGTDLPAFYEDYGGAVLSTTIDRYVYVLLNVTRGTELQITSSDYGTFYRHNSQLPLRWDGDLSLPKAILHQFGIQRGIRMFLASEVPPGTGLGSSSAVAVAIIKGVGTACGIDMSRQELAEFACDMEIGKMGMPIGKQDQYAAAFGGFNFFTFTASGVQVEPIRVAAKTLERFHQSILLFYTGASRNSSTILGEQTRRSASKDAAVVAALQAVKTVAFEAKRLLERDRVRDIGELLHDSWQQKKKFASGITRPFVDESYEIARSRGAIGGKLTGAGGGGFLMLFCEPQRHSGVTEALEARGLKRMEFNFEQNGARVLVNGAGRLTRTLARAV
jgi:D-glycero-alpha-D-manno-heptose-7-phosphate kinase